MGLGAFGSALIFIGSLVGATILGICVLAYAAHCYLVVLESTAAGMDEVPWPDEPFLDWLWKPAYLLGLISVWAFAGAMILLAVNPTLSEYWFFIPLLMLGALWIFFPISLFSSLSAYSLLYLLYWPLLRRLCRRLGQLLFIYLVTAPLIAGAVGLIYLAVTAGWWWLFVAAVLAPAALFLHGRLLGRLAWLIGYRTPVEATKPRKAGKGFKKLKIEVFDPWSIPEEDKLAPLPQMPNAESPAAGAEPVRESYGFMDDAKLEQTWPKRVEVPMDPGYAVAPASATPGYELPPIPMPEQPLPREEELKVESKAAAPPRYVFWSGVVTFPFYHYTRGPWFNLAFCGLIELWFVRMMVSKVGGI